MLALVMTDSTKPPKSGPIDGSEGRDERDAPWTLDELGNTMLDGFKNVMGVAATIDRKVERLDERVSDLESHVYSNPPPPPNDARAVARLVRSKSRSLPAVAADTDELRGHLIALSSKVDTVLDINKQQSRAQGLPMPDSSFWASAGKFLWSREGAKFMLAAIAALSGAFATIYASMAHTEATKAAERPSVVVTASPAGSIIVAPKEKP